MGDTFAPVGGKCAVSRICNQPAKTGAISEYSEIEEAMSPVALGKMAGWILKQTASRPPAHASDKHRAKNGL